MRYNIFISLGILGILVPEIVRSCPSRCLCFRTTVRCMFLQLEKIPQVPTDTTILDLRFNRIRDVPPNAFSDLKKLNTLLLNNNLIRVVVNGAFNGLKELRYLYLYKNNIHTIQPKAFHGLEKLEQLYVHFNDIARLHSETFAALPNLERLFLHNNKLKRLQAGVFSPIKSLRRLRLDSNALICDCQIMWLAEMLKHSRGSTQAAATCQAPENLQGKSLQSISKDDFRCKKPILTKQPKDIDVKFGNTAYLRCRAEGDPQPEILWLHNNNEINRLADGSRKERLRLLDDGTLMIQNAQDTDEGVYECMARNIAGDVKSNSVTVRYHGERGPPKFLKQPEDQTVSEGETVTFTCKTGGYPEPKVTWSKNGEKLPQNPRYTLLATGSLMIVDTQFQDHATYTCTATNSDGTTSANAKLFVKVMPIFVTRPDDQAVLEGSTVEFTCHAKGHPSPTIGWTINNEQIQDSPRISISNSGTTLRVKNVQPIDRGIYKCYAKNEGGRRDTAAYLNVKPRVPPSFTNTPPNDVLSKSLSDIELQCKAYGEPIPTITWIHKGRPIQPSNKFELSSEGSLTINNVTQQDSGTYTCRAENSVGLSTAEVKVKVIAERTIYEGDIFVEESIKEADIEVNTAINQTIANLHDKNRRKSPSDLLTLFRLPSKGALQITRAAEVFERALELIHNKVSQKKTVKHHGELSYKELVSPSHLNTIANLSGCTGHRKVVNCTDMCFHKKFRTLDGTCNNLGHPMWGASLVGMRRFLKPVYENNFNSPVGWNTSKLYFGYPKPSARLVSTKLMTARRIEPDNKFTHMLMQWGQFMDHDIDFIPMALSNARFSDGRGCNETCDNQAPCFPIMIPPDDPRIRHHKCMGFTRSSAMCGTGSTSIFFNKVIPREQINQITSYIDASNVYGSSEEDSNDLRDLSSQRGMLRMGVRLANGKHLLPPNGDHEVDCQIDPNKAHVPCFFAGDRRANEQLGLLSMHHVWAREHNRIATELLKLNPHWDGNMLYHEARKIMGALMQHITYKHWLPKILGDKGMAMMGTYRGYDPLVDATIMNEFSTAALRFGHSLINPVIYRLNASFEEIPQGNLPLHKAFFAPHRLTGEGGIDPILRGLFGIAGKSVKPDGILNSELTEKLFKLAHAVALDLGALNIQRGRDHGLPSYNDVRKKCGLPVAETFDDLTSHISNAELRTKMKKLFGHPGNIDLWVGGLCEDTVEGTRVGITFMCILTEQFKQLRDGDRFWYENPGVFTPAQLTQIKQGSLARTICDNSDSIDRIQRDVFVKADYPLGYDSCENVPKIDLKVWTDCCQDCSKSGEFNSILGHYRRRRSTDSNQYTYKNTNFDPHIEILEPTLTRQVYSNSSTGQKTLFNMSSDKLDVNVNRDSSGRQGKEQYTVIDKLFESEAKDVDDVETRLEGLEEVMAEMKGVIKALQRKVKRLERKLRRNSGYSRSVHVCVDKLGKTRKHKERWKRHNYCTTCECNRGKITCVRHINCPTPACKQPKKVPGKCCPQCL